MKICRNNLLINTRCCSGNVTALSNGATTDSKLSIVLFQYCRHSKSFRTKENVCRAGDLSSCLLDTVTTWWYLAK